MKIFKGIIVIVVLAFAAGCHKQPTAEAPNYLDRAEIIGTVSKVKDGDTVSIISADKRFDIRLYGVDAPEESQSFGLKAKETLTKMALNKRVRVELTGGATYGRIVGIVWVNDKDLNLHMVCQGLAWWSEEFAPNDNDLHACQQTAQQKQLGLWSVPNPIAPWEFRKNRKKK